MEVHLLMGVTTTLYKIIESELIKKGFNEVVNEKGELVFFDNDFAFTRKILNFDKDVSTIVNELFFVGQHLPNPENDKHFKKTFLNRFLNREINRQTVEAFSHQVVYTFMTNEEYINRIYTDLEKYLANRQVNEQKNDGSNVTDNRSAYAELPQNNVNLDVNDTVMISAKDNTINRSKQSNNQQSNGQTENYRLDELFKTNGLLEQVFNQFDKKCFLQVW